MRSVRYLVATIGAVAWWVGAADRAHAFELQVTPDGAPVRWLGDEIVFDLSGLDAAPQAQGAVTVAARRALETWSAAGGPVLLEGDNASTDTARGSISWEPDVSRMGDNAGVLAVTRLSFDTDTGAIQSAHITINGGAFRWATGDGTHCTEAFDLESTLAHEVGHALGLKHSEVLDATMYTRPAPCAKDRRDLATDDLDGLTALYTTPLAHDAPTDDDAATLGGCSAGGGRSSAAMLMLLAAAAILARSRVFTRR